MFYRSELSFLCETFQRCRVNAVYAESNAENGIGLPEREDGIFSLASFFREHNHVPEERTVYKVTDKYGITYRYLLLPETQVRTVLIIGPYLSEPLTPQKIWEIGESKGIPPENRRYFSEYYRGIPVVLTDSPLWAALDVFCERIWKSISFSVRELTAEHAPKNERSDANVPGEERNDALLDILTMERRYTLENEIIHAVERGQSHLAGRFVSVFSPRYFEKRASNPLRNAQNYCIIMNTLLRKAAERGGVHPLHIDRLSSQLAQQIEDMPESSQVPELMSEMFRLYSDLVRSRSLKGLPPIVRQTVLLIDADLSADLCPSLLASRQGVSLGYLSSSFRKATGQTISEHVRKKRMEHAAYLLNNTSLQIQTVAMHIGIMDVQYFSKLFKKEIGMTPTEYRQAMGKVRA